jgi:hypothetical protein
MPEISGYELIGYLASVLVAVSLMMVRMVRLRIVNLCGALGFVIYGWLIASWPVVGMNAFIVSINCYHLWRLATKKEAFSVLAVPPDDPYLLELLKHFADNIAKEQPHFVARSGNIDFARLVVRDGRPAGVLLGQFDSHQGLLNIVLDYALPEYQDFATGRFLYESLPQSLGMKNVVAITTQPSHPLHARYLSKMGFRPESDGSHWKRLL